MGVDCNLELRLLPPSAASSTDLSDHHHHRCDNNHRSLPTLDFLSRSTNNTSEKEMQQRQRQELTIFYNGQLSVCDVTEFQARAIIMHASRELLTEDKPKTQLELGPCCSSLTPQSPASSCGSTASLSMKRSLQRFLQKRKHRIQAASPYSR